MSSFNDVPFLPKHQLASDLDPPSLETQLPGYPRVTLADNTGLVAFLATELETDDLDLMAPQLWMMSTYSSANINTLHGQRVKGRTIVVTENPGLHLVWRQSCIFLKPLPRYLLSHKFWEQFLIGEHSSLKTPGQRDILLRSARGFLRTYFYLIKHESDFHIAQEPNLRLIPNNVSWEEFCSFSSKLDLIDDNTVNARYSYGELRLTRLNFYAKFLLRRFQYEHIYGQYGSFFERFYPHLLFAFGVLSILLNAMQVELAIDQVATQQWAGAWVVWRVFGTFCLILITIVLISLSCLLAWIFGDEWIFAIRAARRKKRERGVCSSSEPKTQA